MTRIRTVGWTVTVRRNPEQTGLTVKENAMKRLQSLVALVAMSWIALASEASGTDFSLRYDCKAQFNGQAHFTENSGTYELSGLCSGAGGQGESWTFRATGSYADGKRIGRGVEQYTFYTNLQGTGPGNATMRLSMDCFGDPWIDDGLCNRDSLRISWTGSPSTILTDLFSPSGQYAPPFTASFLRNDRQLIQTYKSQRQAYLANLQQERAKRQQARITAQAKPVPGLSEKLTAPYMPTILSPGESAQFTKGGPVLLMVKPPERDTLGNVVQIEFQSCVYDQARSACNWIPRGIEGGVTVPDLLAGTYRLPARIVGETGSWRLRVQRPADPAAKTPAGYPSQWRRFGIMPLAAQPGPILKGPVFGR